MKATRDGFGDQLVESAGVNTDILVLGADLGKATRTTKFQDLYPDRFYEIGIAECNMIGIASGMSEHGFRPVISSFASFLTGKYDVIRISLAYSNAPVLIVGTHSGMAIGKDGVTQMGLEDVTLMRALPNMTVLQPATYNECRTIVKWALESEDISGPIYLRLGRQPVKEVFDDPPEFTLGRASILQEGKDVCLMSSGCVLPEALLAADILENHGLTCGIINFPSIKPIDEKAIVDAATVYDHLVSIEDHTVVGGFGSAVSEVLTDKAPCRLLRIGLDDIFPESGPPSDLYKKYGLDGDGISRKVLSYVG